MRAIISWEISPVRSCMAQWADARPSALPATTKTTASVTNWRINRPDDAPRAVRTAISRWRLSRRNTAAISRRRSLTLAIRSNEPAPAHQHHQNGANVSGNDIPVRAATDAPWPRLVAGYCFSSCWATHVTLLKRSRDRDAILKAGHAIETVAASPHIAGAGGVERAPELGGLSGSKVKVAWQHADDDARGAIERNYAAQHVALSSEPLLPGCITQQSRAAARPSRSSPAEKSRPSTGVTPSVRKNPSLTRTARTGSVPAAVLSRKPLRWYTSRELKDAVESLPIEIVGIGKIALWKFLDTFKDPD